MKIRNLLLAAPILFAVGCTTHYRVTDPATGTVYYTTGMDKKKAGAVEFKDEKSGETITLQNSSVVEISGDEFNRETGSN